MLNAANEAAVDLFLAHKCAFMDIPRLIAAALEAHRATNPGNQPLCAPHEGAAPENHGAGLTQEAHTLAERMILRIRQSLSLLLSLAALSLVPAVPSRAAAGEARIELPAPSQTGGMELETAVRLNANVLHIIWVDNAYNMTTGVSPASTATSSVRRISA